jgi:23S rRNA-/tRNA-specific pseudouridylate synthase
MDYLCAPSPTCWRNTLTAAWSERFTVSGQSGAQRLDRILRARYPQSGRQAIQQLIGQRQVLVNGRVVWLASWSVSNGDRITVLTAPAPAARSARCLRLRWLLADERRPPRREQARRSPLRTQTRRDAPFLAANWPVARFGPLTLFHRLDRDTSGVLLLTRGAALNRELAQAWQTHAVTKEYRAVVAAQGALATSGVIELRLAPDSSRRDQMVVVPRGGERAVTRYAVLGANAAGIVVQLWPETGRTHQLRVHLAHLGAVILGDRLYGNPASAPRLMLHAHRLSLPPLAGAPLRTYVAPLPPGFDLD